MAGIVRADEIPSCLGLQRLMDSPAWLPPAWRRPGLASAEAWLPKCGILAFGDSLVHGYGLAADADFSGPSWRQALQRARAFGSRS